MPIEIAGVITGIEFITKNKRNMRLKPVESIWKKSESKLDTCSYYCLILISGFGFFFAIFWWNDVFLKCADRFTFKTDLQKQNRIKEPFFFRFKTQRIEEITSLFSHFDMRFVALLDEIVSVFVCLVQCHCIRIWFDVKHSNFDISIDKT